MDVKDIKRLLDAVAASGVSEFSLETGDYKLLVKRQGSVPNDPQGDAPRAAPADAPMPVLGAETLAPSAALTVPAPLASGPNLLEVTAPIVGTFYAAPAPDVPDYVKIGDTVKAGQVLCVIEAMKLMNEIEADAAGVVREILVKNEEPVEYGQVLFRIEPS